VRRSHVLAAMGVPDDLAQAAIRVSFGWNSVEEDLTLFERAFAKAVGTMKARQVRAA
jgi:cysteine desulfurase